MRKGDKSWHFRLIKLNCFGFMAFDTAEENVANKQNHGFNQSDIYIIYKKYILYLNCLVNAYSKISLTILSMVLWTYL